MTELKTVCIFALLCCATTVARASLVLSADNPADNSTNNSTVQNSPVVLVSTDAPTVADWAVPAGLDLHSIRTGDVQSATAEVEHSITPGESKWVASPTELSQPASLAVSSDQTGDFHATAATTMPLMSIASVAIPLPLAFPAGIAGLGLAVFFSVLWKKRSASRD